MYTSTFYTANISTTFCFKHFEFKTSLLLFLLKTYCLIVFYTNEKNSN